MHSSIGKIIIGSDGKPIINVSAVVQAMKAQLSIEAQYRQIFGCDLGTRPGPVMLEDQVLMLAKIQAVQEYRATLASLQMVPLPPGYATMTPQQQMRAGSTATAPPKPSKTQQSPPCPRPTTMLSTPRSWTTTTDSRVRMESGRHAGKKGGNLSQVGPGSGKQPELGGSGSGYPGKSERSTAQSHLEDSGAEP